MVAVLALSAMLLSACLNTPSASSPAKTSAIATCNSVDAYGRDIAPTNSPGHNWILHPGLGTRLAKRIASLASASQSPALIRGSRSLLAGDEHDDLLTQVPRLFALYDACKAFGFHYKTVSMGIVAG
jgi:predicted small secreted protein